MVQNPQERPLASMDPHKHPSEEEVLDIVEEASLESFPASESMSPVSLVNTRGYSNGPSGPPPDLVHGPAYLLAGNADANADGGSAALPL